MGYIAVHLFCNEDQAETLSFLLQEDDYLGTSYENNELIAYVEDSVFNDAKLHSVVASLGLKIDQITKHEDQNWNQVWEDNFRDLMVGDKIHVRAPFHNKENTDYEIIINPKMAFGTGHHSTTRLMMLEMLDHSFINKHVLDMGCGSGILAILASQLGAQSVTAIDYDINSVENSIENMQLNNIKNVDIFQASNLNKTEKWFDIILSNIVKNINLKLLDEFALKINKGGILMLCGLLVEDKEEVLKKCSALNLKFINEREEENWLQLTMVKTA